MSSFKGFEKDGLLKTSAKRVLRSAVRRGTLLAVVSLFWWGVPYALFWLLLTYSLKDSILSFFVGFWLLSTVFPALPGTGIIAALVGLFSKDKLIGFLFGLLPSVVLSFLSLTRPSYGDCLVACSGPDYVVMIYAVGLGFGLMGLGGALYGTWEDEPAKAGQRTLRTGVLAGILGFSLWLAAVWGRHIFYAVSRLMG